MIFGMNIFSVCMIWSIFRFLKWKRYAPLLVSLFCCAALHRKRPDPPVADIMQQFDASRLRVALFVQLGEIMKICKSCRGVIIGEAATQSLRNLEKLMEFHGFTPKTIPDVALSMGPMCEQCLKNWSQELTAP